MQTTVWHKKTNGLCFGTEERENNGVSSSSGVLRVC
jgi:hypothetical protein